MQCSVLISCYQLPPLPSACIGLTHMPRPPPSCCSMSDLALPFLLLFEDDALAFWCFEKLMRKVSRAVAIATGPSFPHVGSVIVGFHLRCQLSDPFPSLGVSAQGAAELCCGADRDLCTAWAPCQHPGEGRPCSPQQAPNGGRRMKAEEPASCLHESSHMHVYLVAGMCYWYTGTWLC